MSTSIPHSDPLTRDYAEYLACRLARRDMAPAHVIDDQGHYLIASDLDMVAGYWHTEQVVFTIEPEAVCDIGMN